MLNPRPFDQIDWDAFSGCESKNPFIAVIDTESRGITIIFDETTNIFITDDVFDDTISYMVNENQVSIITALAHNMLYTDFETWLNNVEKELIPG